jgi:hypothetical protein
MARMDVAGRIGRFVLILVLVIPLLFCSTALIVLIVRPGAGHLPNTDNPPLYPNAEEVQVRNKDPLDYDVVYKTISFKTSDTPNAVLAFYEEALVKDGWSLQERKSANELRFQWSTQIMGRGTTRLYYWADVTARQPQLGETSVEIKLSTQER